jgi:hypothetical protein
VPYCFFEKIEPHKAILIKLSWQDSKYEVLTFFREYEYLNTDNRKPNFYLSDLQKCTQETILLKEVSYNDFLQVLQKMNFKESSKERFEVIASFTE